MDNATLDAPDLRLNDYRALREGREVKAVEEKPSEAPPADKPGDAGTAAESEPADETVEEQPSDDGKPPKPPAKRGLVDEITKLRRENRELKSRVTPPPEQPKPAPPVEAKAADDPEPDINNYSDYSVFNRDFARWQFRELRREAAAEDQKRQVQQAEQAKREAWQSRVKAVAASKADFDVVALDPYLPVSPVMGDAIVDAENGPEILYHLGSHPDEAARISKLSPIAQIREIGKLELAIAKQNEASSAAVIDEEAPPQIKPAISKAPAPVPRPSASAAKGNPAKNLESISQAEYRALRESGRL